MSEKPWKHCEFCANIVFSSPYQFGDHLRLCHSKKEGGSYVCLFGPNSICPLLPYEGVSDRDYESHVAKCHIFSLQKQTISDQSRKIDNGEKTLKKSTLESNQHNNKITRNDKFPNFPNPSKNGFFNYFNEDNGNKYDKPNVIDDNEWNIYSSYQNLTSVLNDPSKSRSHYDNIFTKDWGVNFIDLNVVPAYPILKKPSQILFENYANKINKRSKRYTNNSIISTKDSKRNESLALTIVPPIFFNSDFNLEDSETFTSLLCLFESNKSDESLKMFFDQKSMNDIQKSLSEYLDVVEQDLAQQIGQRSKDFFHVMSSMDLVMEKLKISIKQVTNIRESCFKLEESLIVPIEKNIELTKLRANYRDIFKKINWIATVHQTQPTIQLLLSKNDYAGALDLISTSQEVVTQELNGVISFRHLKLQLMEIEKVIEQMMNEEFIKYLTAEWNRPISQDSNYNIQEERLLSIIYGMLKLQKFNFIDTFREEAFTAIKTNVKQTVIETLSSEDNIEVSRIDSSLFEQLKCLNFDKWLKCLKLVFSRLETLLKRVSLVYNVINNGFLIVTDSSTNNGQSTNANSENLKVILQSDCHELRSNLKEILCSVCDFAHSRCANIIELRVNDGSLDQIDSVKFLELIQLIDGFVNACELICSKKSPNLKLVIQIQSNKFVSKFHDERKNKLKQLLDMEQWKSTNNFNEDFQMLCNQLVNIEEYQSLKEVYSNFKEIKLKNSFDKKINCILFENEKFVVVNSVINLIYIILDYCEYAQEISILSPDLLLRLVDLLKFFNSRTSQLILGAEALQISGLKTISARTLIISSRTLAFVMKFVPRVRKHFECLLQARQMNMLKHFDELLELYENHHSKIPDKVISLVGDVATSYLSKWVAKAPVPSVSFQTISQHLSRLHDNIQDIMPRQDLLSMFQKIHFIIVQIFRFQLQKLKIMNDGGPQHGLVTQELTFYIHSLKNLSIGSELDLGTNDLWTKPR